ncbi:unnamed protein product [Rotaria sp. Silwood2]|nr:unnamed protein product [Rotaria sp. Silwood2]CAF3039786.1 unnamed protein product [Rotaria sp. Silwood2]CAF4141703.1 unnamed protein product [Rotaria sp. Silwood2]CAF4252635.1 unnamed protein product [Rotaria sp. Silwood2]CAF4472463.1 unnamed protein product [Rotaria sp. Silwood2]
MSFNEDVSIWIDLEIDGLDLTINFILEIACIVADFDLTNIHQDIIYSYFLLIKYFLGPDLVINHSKSLLDAMGSWCTEHHTKSDFVQQVLDSKLSMSNAETEIINFIQQVTSFSTNKKRLILAENFVYVDRYFLEKDMPRLNSLLDRSILDCSTLKELIHRFNYKFYTNAPIKTGNHNRALDDIRNSIKELKYYQKSAFENLNIIDEIVDGKINDDLMKFVRRNQIYRERRLVVAGKSLGSIRSELKNLAPQFSEFCHYRSIDIDAISVSCEKWFLNIYKQRPFKNDNDLKNSIELLRFYHSTIFK